MKRITGHWAFWPLLLACVLRGVALWWGLPGSDGWDNDGVAPRDVYPGLVASFTPGEYYTYPPLHLATLGLLTSPIALWGALASPSLQTGDLVQTLLRPGYMTAIAVVARVVSLLLSLGTTWLIADLARRTSGLRTARLAAWIGAVNMGFTYYGKTSNLDVPCVFYATLAIWLLARDQLVPNARHKLLAALAAVAAVTTKDQAYAAFVLVLPLCFGASLWRTRGSAWQRLRPWVVALATGVAGYAIASTLLFNPQGFFRRLAFLRGSASQDFMIYSNDLRGRIATLIGCANSLRNLLGTPLLLLAAVGLGVVAVQTVRPGRRLARTLPGLAALSFFLFFNCIARRGEERFVLLASAMLAFYAALALAYLDSRLSGQLALPTRFLTPLFLAPALWRSIALDAGLLHDPRYSVEHWLAEHPGRIETYGNDVYLPRFERDTVRVSPPEAPIRSPLPGVVDRVGAFTDVESRKPDFLVVPHAFVWRYRMAPDEHADGYVTPKSVQHLAESDGGRFFRDLFDEKLSYHRVLLAECDDRVFERIMLHAAVCEPVSVFARTTP